MSAIQLDGKHSEKQLYKEKVFKWNVEMLSGLGVCHKCQITLL